MSNGTETEWEKTVSVGKAQVRGTFQLLSHNFYNVMDNLLSERIITGNSQVLGMKLGRIKEALIINGVAWSTTSKGKKRKLLYVTHPDFNDGEEFRFEVAMGDELPLTNAPAIPSDGEFMATLGDNLAGAIADLNPGLEYKYGDLFSLFVKKDDDDNSEADNEDDDSEAEEVEPRENPTESATPSSENEEDTSTSEPTLTSGPSLVQ